MINNIAKAAKYGIQLAKAKNVEKKHKNWLNNLKRSETQLREDLAKACKWSDYFNELGTPSTYVLEGNTEHLCMGRIELDVATDVTEFLALVEDALGIVQLTSTKIKTKEIDELSSTAMTSLAQAILTGWKLIHELRADHLIRRCTKVTKADATETSPMTKTALAGIQLAIQNGEVWIHPLSVILADVSCAVIQLHSNQEASGYNACLFLPIGKWTTVAEIDALQEGLKEEREAKDAARILGTPMRPLEMRDINKTPVYSKLSAYALWISNFLPCEDDVAATAVAFDDSSPALTFWLDELPISELFGAGVMLRDFSQTDKPRPLNVLPPSAGKLSFLTVAASGTSWVEYPDSSAGFDFIKSVATRRSVVCSGIIGDRAPGVFAKLPGMLSATHWNRMFAQFMADHFNGKMLKPPSLGDANPEQAEFEAVDYGSVGAKSLAVNRRIRDNEVRRGVRW